MEFHHIPWTAHTVERRRAWHDITTIGQHTVGRRGAWHNITALGQHTQLDYVKRGMTSPPLDSTHSRTTSAMVCHHRLWAAHTVERRRAWHAIIALGQHTRSDDNERGMISQSLDSSHCQTKSGVACHHRLWTTHTVERRRVWHAIIAF